MSNNFKEIESRAVLPAYVKQQTLGNLETMKVMLKVLDLFLVKAGSTLSRSLEAQGPEMDLLPPVDDDDQEDDHNSQESENH